MRTEVRRKLEMAARVREFILAHSGAESSYVPVLERMQERLKRAGAVADRQNGKLDAARAARAQRKELRRILQFQLLHYLVAVGSFAAGDRTELVQRFKLPPGNLSNAGFVSKVRALVAFARDHKDLLTSQGMDEAVLDELDRRVTELEAVTETVRTERRDHITARVELEVITGDLMKEVKLADGITRYRFGMSPERMAEWNAVRQVPGQARGGVAPATGNGEVPPGPGGGVAPAA